MGRGREACSSSTTQQQQQDAVHVNIRVCANSADGAEATLHAMPLSTEESMHACIGVCVWGGGRCAMSRVAQKPPSWQRMMLSNHSAQHHYTLMLPQGYNEPQLHTRSHIHSLCLCDSGPHACTHTPTHTRAHSLQQHRHGTNVPAELHCYRSFT